MMTIKALAIWFTVTAATFGACCLIMAWFGSGMNEPAVVYPFVAIWGLSALLWPMFLIQMIRAALTKTRNHAR